ncbi:helix-turn-helix domain-containing protein [Streptomyces sp. NPDC056670]|uniref:helix-turn-helix domain-containing protein n=1 Tax=Streptomyces sp. NPDC056670 TaxID=3345904 RepID=UPI00369C087F
MAAPQSEAALQRLAEAVTRRRAQLSMTKIDVARAADVTITTFSRIENAQSVRDVTYGKIEPVLQWAFGSCRDIFDGKPPTPLEQTPMPGAAYVDIDEADLERDFIESVQNGALAVSDDATAADIRKLVQAAVEEWRRRRGKNTEIGGS